MSEPDQNERKLFPEQEKDDLSTHGHRQVIGYIGFALPLLLWLISGLRPTADLPWAPLTSISAYYYSGAVSVFTGMLIALSLFLFTYQGYDNAFYRRDRIAACIAGTAAVLIALFPTGAPSKLLELSWWTPLTGTVHLVSAGVLFSCLIYFSYVLFPLSNPDQSTPLPADKQRRNVLYKACAVAIALCMAWVVYEVINQGPIFWPEVLALWAFAISWLVKGRAIYTAAAAGRNTVYYASHPGRLVRKVKRAMRSQPEPKVTQQHADQ